MKSADAPVLRYHPVNNPGTTGAPMRRLCALVLGTLFATTSMGQDLLAGIDPDVLRGLLLPGEQSLVATTAVPAELSAIRMPRELRWIGSAERTLGPAPGPGVPVVVIAAWRSDAPPATASRLAIDALAAGGGTTVQPAMSIGQGVFKTARAAPPQQQVCRDGRPFTVISNAMDGVTYVVVQIQRSTTGLCDARMRPSFLGGGELAAHLPELEIPVDPGTGQAARIHSSGGGGSPEGRSTVRVGFALRDSAANVASHFARQMSAQGWQQDTSWSGSVTAGSSWLKPRESAPPLNALLQVMTTGDGQFITMLSLGAGK